MGRRNPPTFLGLTVIVVDLSSSIGILYHISSAAIPQGQLISYNRIRPGVPVIFLMLSGGCHEAVQVRFR